MSLLVEYDYPNSQVNSCLNYFEKNKQKGTKRQAKVSSSCKIKPFKIKKEPVKLALLFLVFKKIV
jgi:hypothetical protein